MTFEREDAGEAPVPARGNGVPSSARANGSGSDPQQRSSIMNIGRRVDYAVRALCYLAAQPEPVSVERIARAARRTAAEAA